MRKKTGLDYVTLASYEELENRLEFAERELAVARESMGARISGLETELEQSRARIRELEQAGTDLGNLLAAWHAEYTKTKPAQLAQQTTATIMRVRPLFEGGGS
jgi:hypothetical protein